MLYQYNIFIYFNVNYFFFLIFGGNFLYMFFFSNLWYVNLCLSYSIINLDLFGNLVVYKDSVFSW